MDILNLGGINEPSERPSKKKLKVIIGIGLLAGVMGMGSTLAASITLNGGTNVEFGQGVQLVTACDSAITVTPRSTFVNASTGSGGANFALTSVELTLISDNCAGKSLRLNAYTDSATVGQKYTSSGSGTSTALGFGIAYTTSGMKFGGSTPLTGTGAPLNVGCTFVLASTALNTPTSYSCGGTENKSQVTVSGDGTTITISFNSSSVSPTYQEPILAAAVDKFTLESSV